MSHYYVKTIHGRHLLCGGVIPAELVKPGQRWASADGSNREVTVRSSDGDWVTYLWSEKNEERIHTKLNFAFQCRYCLVLDTPELPKELT